MLVRCTDREDGFEITRLKPSIRGKMIPYDTVFTATKNIQELIDAVVKQQERLKPAVEAQA